MIGLSSHCLKTHADKKMSKKTKKPKEAVKMDLSSLEELDELELDVLKIGDLREDFEDK